VSDGLKESVGWLILN